MLGLIGMCHVHAIVRALQLRHNADCELIEIGIP